MIKKKDHIILISFPFLRLGRILLSPLVLETILNQTSADILIIGPTVEEKLFQSEFRHERIHYLKWREKKNPNLLERLLATIAVLQRMHGYWFRFRNTGMEYYNNISYFDVNSRCELDKKNIFKFFIYKIFAVTGVFEKAWRVTDNIRGLIFRRTKIIDEIIEPYKRVTLIQSANWGEQDIWLGWYARKNKIESILIPYTTDQLFCNGYLLNNYKYLCVQGNADKVFIEKFNNSMKDKVVDLGSVWFRNIDSIKKTIEIKNKSNTKKILFAGNSSMYFPLESELKTLEYLNTAVESGCLNDSQIVYRPVLSHENEEIFTSKIKDKYSGIEVQIPQLSMIGLGQAIDTSMKREWNVYVSQLMDADVLIVNIPNSLALDFAYLGKPVIVVIDDYTGKIWETNFHHTLKSFFRLSGFIYFSVVFNLSDMLCILKNSLDNPQLFKEHKNVVDLFWDQNNVDFVRTLTRVIN